MIFCKICGSHANIFKEYRGIDADNKIEVELFLNKMTARCVNCGYIFCIENTEYDRLKQYYKHDYWSPSGRGGNSGKRLISKLRNFVSMILSKILSKRYASIMDKINIIDHYIDSSKPFSILEIGAGAAGMSRAFMKKHKTDVADVVEPSDSFQDIYRWSRIRKIADTFEDMDGNNYDLVMSQHWLEHTIDIDTTFKKMAEILANNGFVYLEVPNCEDPYFDYRYFPNPPHLHFFTPKAIRYLFEKYNYNVEFIVTYGRPLECEKHIGFLEVDSPKLIGKQELSRLNLLRKRKDESFMISLKDDEAKNIIGYSDQGREYIMVLARCIK